MLKTFTAFKRYANAEGMLHVLTDQEIKNIQSLLLQIMDDFDSLCRMHGWTYFLTGGSALGAVRENGFISWDDDIDIGMPRKDYDQFLRFAEQELGSDYWLQSLNSSDRYDLCFAKLRKKGTKYVEIFENEPEKAGLFLDIFPLENTYDSAVRRFFNGIVDETLFFIASCVRIHQKKERLLHYTRGSRLVYSIRFKALLGKLFDHSPDSRKWYKRCERWQSRCSCPNSKYVTFSCGRGHYFGELYRRDHIFPVKEHVFEGRQYFIPNRPEHLLTKLYGKNYLIPDAPASREKHCVVEWSPGADT